LSYFRWSFSQWKYF